MSTAPIPQGRNSSWSSKIPGPGEFGLLMNLLPEAAALIDIRKRIILQTNGELAKITAFTAAELIGKPISTLFVNGIGETQITGDEVPMVITRRSREPLDVVVRMVGLDISAQWFLVVITPVGRVMNDWLEEQERISVGLSEMASLYQLSNIDEALNRSVDISRMVLGVDVVSIYLAGANTPKWKLEVSSGDSTLLPEVIESTDLIRLAATTMWMPGKRVETEIQRAARMANMSFLVSAPLGEESALVGFLVLGNSKDDARETVIPITTILAKLITNTYQHFLLVENLEQLLTRQERELNHHAVLLENMKIGSLIVDSDLNVTEINPAAEMMLGYSTWEVVGKPVLSILIGVERLAPALMMGLEGKLTPSLDVVYFHRRDGQLLPTEVQVLPVMLEGEIQGLMLIITDVSKDEAWKVQNRQLEHKAAVGEITQVFAHEIRNPINNINAGLQLLEVIGPQEPNFQDKITRMENDCDRLENFMELILAYSRAESKLEPVYLNAFVKSFVDRWLPRFYRFNIKSFYQSEDDIPPILADPRQLDQVFTNLITNAVDAMRETGGTLAINIRINQEESSRKHVEVLVTDSGPGIPEEILQHIFSPFYTNKPNGTGLGLAITRQIVVSLHGTIRPSSFPGGTTFHVMFPAIENGELDEHRSLDSG